MLCVDAQPFHKNGSPMSQDTLALPFSIIVSRSFCLIFVAAYDDLSDMPICDGIEACKRIRLLENKRKVSISLPSTSS